MGQDLFDLIFGEGSISVGETGDDERGNNN
jgi:hypothetical protein